MKNGTLKFDIKEMSKMRKKMQDTSEKLEKLKNELLKEIESLKDKWKTPAGKKFTEEVDLGWVKQIDKYITIIKGMDELLEVAESNYRHVEEEADKVTF